MIFLVSSGTHTDKIGVDLVNVYSLVTLPQLSCCRSTVSIHVHAGYTASHMRGQMQRLDDGGCCCLDPECPELLGWFHHEVVEPLRGGT